MSIKATFGSGQQMLAATKEIRMFKSAMKTVLSSAAALSLALGAAPAFATSYSSNQTVSNVLFSAEFGTYGELALILPSGTFYADPGAGSPGCSIPAATADAVKIWIGLAQAAQLSAKTVTVAYIDCSGYHWLVGVTLNT